MRSQYNERNSGTKDKERINKHSNSNRREMISPIEMKGDHRNLLKKKKDKDDDAFNWFDNNPV